jgi:hypothetical protein
VTGIDDWLAGAPGCAKHVAKVALKMEDVVA